MVRDIGLIFLILIASGDIKSNSSTKKDSVTKRFLPQVQKLETAF